MTNTERRASAEEAMIAGMQSMRPRAVKAWRVDMAGLPEDIGVVVEAANKEIAYAKLEAFLADIGVERKPLIWRSL